MKRLMNVVLFIILLFAVQHSYAFKKSRIIFYYVKAGEGVTIEDKETLKKAVRNALRNNPKFEVVSDENIEAVFKRNGISEDGCTTTECAVKIGNDASIAADYVMYGDLNISKQGLFLINVRVVNVEKKSIFWEPSRIYRAESLNKFYSVANSIIDEFAKIIPVEPQVKEIRSDGSLIVDVGSRLGMKKGARYYAIVKMQFGGPFDVQVDTLALVQISQVAPELSLAKVVKKYKELTVGAKLMRTTGEVDDSPPVIQHEVVTSAGKNMDIPIEAEISDNKSVKQALLHFSLSPTGAFITLPMSKVHGERNIYSTVIYADQIGDATAVYYYISAEDGNGNRRVFKDANGQPIKINIKAKDTTPPQITYNQPEEKDKTNEIIFSAKVTDDVRVKKVVLYYRPENSGEYSSIPLKLFAKDIYGVGVPIAKIQASHVWYYLEAVDYAGNATRIGEPNAPIYLKISSNDVIPPKVKILQTITREGASKYSVIVYASDDNAVDNVQLVYSINKNGKSGQKISVPMQMISPGEYKAIIDLPVDEDMEIVYYAKATDANGNVGKSISNVFNYRKTGKDASKVIKYDRTPPVFSNFYPIHFGLKTLNYHPGGKLVYPVILKVEDNIGVDNVKVFYRNMGEMDFHALNMGKISKEDDYGILLIGSDRGIEFYFKAEDANNNTSFFANVTDPFKIIPEKLGKLPTSLRKQANGGR